MNSTKDFGQLTPQEVDRLAEEQAEKLTEQRVKTNQVRNLYSVVQRVRATRDRAGDPEGVKAEIMRQLIFLKPRLAYASARTPGLRALRNFLANDVIDGVARSARFGAAIDNFFTLMEAIVAYHYFYGKDKGLVERD